MTDLERKIEELTEKVDSIIKHFNIGKNVIRLADIREKARKDVERKRQNERKAPA